MSYTKYGFITKVGGELIEFASDAEAREYCEHHNNNNDNNKEDNTMMNSAIVNVHTNTVSSSTANTAAFAKVHDHFRRVVRIYTNANSGWYTTTKFFFNGKDGSSKNDVPSFIYKRKGYERGKSEEQNALIGLLNALREVKKEKCFEVIIDAKFNFIVNAFNDGLLRKWSKNHWKTESGRAVPNAELWSQIAKELKRICAPGMKVKCVKQA